eukprot:Opistho-2@46538
MSHFSMAPMPPPYGEEAKFFEQLLSFCKHSMVMINSLHHAPGKADIAPIRDQLRILADAASKLTDRTDAGRGFFRPYENAMSPMDSGMKMMPGPSPLPQGRPFPGHPQDEFGSKMHPMQPPQFYKAESMPAMAPFVHPPRRDGRSYSLQVRQQPIHGSTGGIGVDGAKGNRRPIDPAPILQLHIRDAEGRNLDACTGLDPYLICTAELYSAENNANRDYMSSKRNIQNLTGILCSSMHRIKDLAIDGQGNELTSNFYVFSDLSVREKGKYFLKFCLYLLHGDESEFLSATSSDVFEVLSTRDFQARGGLGVSTPLSVKVSYQGVKLQLRSSHEAKGDLKPPPPGINRPHWIPEKFSADWVAYYEQGASGQPHPQSHPPAMVSSAMPPMGGMLPHHHGHLPHQHQPHQAQHQMGMPMMQPMMMQPMQGMQSMQSMQPMQAMQGLQGMQPMQGMQGMQHDGYDGMARFPVEGQQQFFMK